MMQEVMITAAQGRVLEGFLHSKDTGNFAVLLVHPYAALGGSMHDFVIITILRGLAQSSDVRCALAYNQAGVGRSSSKGFFQSSTDTSDLQAAAEYVQSRDPGSLKLVIVGYSYGACVAASGLSALAVSGFVIVAPPIGVLANTFLQSRSMLRHSLSFGGPILIIHGDIDQFASLAQIQEFVETFQKGRKEDDWPQVLCLEGCDHFFQGEQASVADAVCRWIFSTSSTARISA